MDITSKSKWQVRMAALLIFLLGASAGALALNAYKRWNRSGVEASRHNRFDKMLDNLQLSTDQKTQVHQILSETREQLQGLRKEAEPRFDEIRRQADERLQKVLTPEQWKQFQQERDKMRSRGRRGKENWSSSPQQ
jgi:Spy/CpxP family protein refolding chaperone